RLHGRDDGKGRFPAHCAGHYRPVPLCLAHQPAALAAALQPGRRTAEARLTMDTIATTTTTGDALITASGICKTYQQRDHAGRLILDHIDFSLKEGEIVAILGKSGSGKSTFLRVVAGLRPPTEGTVTYRGQTLYSPGQGLAMLFQTFA